MTAAPKDALAGWIATGRVMGTYGAAGELRVQPLGRFPERFRELRRVFVGEHFEPAAVVHRRAYRQGLILRLDQVRSRETARQLIGSYLYVPESEAVPLPAGEYFVHQIVGLSVRTADDQDLGQVAEVLQTGSNDVYVVKGPQGEVLLPATKEVIRSIDLDAGTMLVALLPGLID